MSNEHKIADSITDGLQYDECFDREEENECQCCGDVIHSDHTLCAECADDLGMSVAVELEGDL